VDARAEDGLERERGGGRRDEQEARQAGHLRVRLYGRLDRAGRPNTGILVAAKSFIVSSALPVDVDLTSVLACPSCRGTLTRSEAAFRCSTCARDYAIEAGVPQFDPPAPAMSGPAFETAAREERRDYWDKGWEARYARDHAHLARLTTAADWRAYLEAESVRLRAVRHISCLEAGRDVVAGKVVLDIGCGGGISSALFGYFGARYLGVDHSPHAAAYARRHLEAVAGEGFSVQGNAERLPFRDSSIDVVYSNGVLHHTPHLATAMDEAYRVLKPGGRAVIGLYSTYSTQFGLIQIAGRARHLGGQARDRFMSHHTEHAWRTTGRLNPWTKTYSRREVTAMVRKYAIDDLKFRFNGNPIGELPFFGRRLMRLGVVRRLDRSLEPLLGSMLITSFTKSSGLRGGDDLPPV
jgi:ubiquinone/menaquinone biosynthesis C-methylase UbiE